MIVDKNTCLHCEKTADEAPLIAVRFQGEEFWICAQHLPILIHKPAQLADKLPSLGNLGPSEGHGH